MGPRVLVLVDDSPTSDATVQYVIDMLDGRADSGVTILGLLPPGADEVHVIGEGKFHHRAAKDKVEAEYERDRLIAERAARCRHASDQARERLVEAGFARDRIHVLHEIVRPEMDLAEKLAGIAKAFECGTIAVHGLGDGVLQSHKVPERLVRRLRDLTMWIVHLCSRLTARR